MPEPRFSFFEERLAYSRQSGRGPMVMFCSGFKSDMLGSKASALAAHCAARGQAFLRFDYTGHGRSQGRFIDGSIGQWMRDARDLLDAHSEGPVLLVGSSMGAWIALHLAEQRPERVHGLIGVASAPDFTECLIWEKLNREQQTILWTEGVYPIPACDPEEASYPITRHLIEEARAHLVLERPLAISVPVHLLHGTADADVPIALAEKLQRHLPQAELTAIPGGDHRLSRPQDLALLCETVDRYSEGL